MKTYDRATFTAARAAWADGGFGPEWAVLRRLSWERGFPYPPAGSVHDTPEVDEPSQRAVIWQWLDNRPTELAAIVSRSHSWSQVVNSIIGMRQRLQEDAELSDRDAEWDRERRPSYREAVTSIAAILTRIGDSA